MMNPFPFNPRLEFRDLMTLDQIDRFAPHYCVVNMKVKKAQLFNGKIVSLGNIKLTKNEELFSMNPSQLLREKFGAAVLEHIKKLPFEEISIPTMDKKEFFVRYVFHLDEKEKKCFISVVPPSHKDFYILEFIGETFEKVKLAQKEKQKSLINIKSLQALEKLCKPKNLIFISETRYQNPVTKSVSLIPEDNIYKAVRTLDGTLKTRTHNIHLYLETGYLWWENNNSKDWEYTFSTPDEAKLWWEKYINIHLNYDK